MPVILPAKDGFIWELKNLDRQGKAKQNHREVRKKEQRRDVLFLRRKRVSWVGW